MTVWRDDLGSAVDLLRRLSRTLGGLTDPDAILPAADRARALAEVAETLANDRLWSGPGGEAAAELISSLMTESEGLPEIERSKQLFGSICADSYRRISRRQGRAGRRNRPSRPGACACRPARIWAHV